MSLTPGEGSQGPQLWGGEDSASLWCLPWSIRPSSEGPFLAMLAVPGGRSHSKPPGPPAAGMGGGMYPHSSLPPISAAEMRNVFGHLAELLSSELCPPTRLSALGQGLRLEPARGPLSSPTAFERL